MKNQSKQVSAGTSEKSLLWHDVHVIIKTLIFQVFTILCIFGIFYLSNYKLNIVKTVEMLSPVATESAEVK